MNTAKAVAKESSRGIPFDILRAYGIGDDITDIWKKSYGESLLPIQEKAIVKHNVLGGRNLIIFAPTSSGKTLVGEIVSVHYAMAKKRALYLVPMKALAEENGDCQDRAELDDDLERSGLLPAEAKQVPDDDQVARYRDEFGESLDEAKHGGDEQILQR